MVGVGVCGERGVGGAWRAHVTQMPMSKIARKQPARQESSLSAFFIQACRGAFQLSRSRAKHVWRQRISLSAAKAMPRRWKQRYR